MPEDPVRILIAQATFVPELARRMTVPHTLTGLDGRSDDEVVALINESDVMVSGAYKPQWRTAAPTRPLLVQSIGAGVDGIAFEALPPGSTVCNVYGHERAVAERAFLHMLALQQGLLGLDRSLRQGNWTPERPFLPELRFKNLLILGLGHIGRELVRWGRFLEMETVVLTRTSDPRRAQDLDLKAFGGLSDLAEYLPWADFVVVAIPNTPTTTGFIGARELGLMKSTAFIINVGRGPVIDEMALFTALRDRQIAGAGLDVWYRYPTPGTNLLPATQPFHTLDNIVMTPHKATIETMEYRWKAIAENIARHRQQQPLHNIVWSHPSRP